MPSPRAMSKDDMITAISELDQAIYTHEQWTEGIYAALICRLPADTRDIGEEPHRKCRFGQWYYGQSAAKLSGRPGFAALEAEHKQMHEYARNLLRISSEGRPISLQDYDLFVTTLKRMRLEVQGLKHELEISLYNIDALTGVPGRMEAQRKLREQHEITRPDTRRCAIAMVDVDGLKTINETQGRLAGDHVLADIARYVQSHLRPYDMIFRYGGEEFLLCMPDTDAEGCRDICDRLRRELAELEHALDGVSPFHATVSVGVAELGTELPVEDAIDRAEQALLAAKAAGRNRCVVWSGDLSRISNVA